MPIYTSPFVVSMTVSEHQRMLMIIKTEPDTVIIFEELNYI